MNLQRRQFLRRSAALAAMSATPWPAMQALAAVNGSGYKALVCLFMFGGNDGNNLLVPTDATRWGLYQRARPNLALPREQLLPVPGAGEYGLHPAMAGLQTLVNSGRGALLANVGPLMVPTSKAQAQARSVPLPANLFSHSDQQVAWQSALVDQPARNGWGGRLLERALPTTTLNRGYSAISVAGGNVWETGDQSITARRVSSDGAQSFEFYDPDGSDPLSVAVGRILREPRSDPFEQTWLNTLQRAHENQRVLTQALATPTLQTAFPNSSIGRQLRMIALLVAARASLGVSRQCFFCSVGGFDTHGDDQLPRQNELLGEISAGVLAFQTAMEELGTERDVTLFSASDFGRNLPSNGQGTDHAWGSHHFVVGGAVNGNRLYGRFPELVINGPDDIGQGTWVPALSTEQVGADLARWYGADESTLDEVFPRLRYFNRSIGLMG